MIDRAAIVDKTTYNVINVIIYDDESEWQPPENCFLVKNSNLNIGDIYSGS